MYVGNYTRALAAAAVTGVVVVGPVAFAATAHAAPGGNGNGQGQANGQAHGQDKAQGHAHGQANAHTQGNPGGSGNAGAGTSSPGASGSGGHGNAGGPGNAGGHGHAGGNGSTGHVTGGTSNAGGHGHAGGNSNPGGQGNAGGSQGNAGGGTGGDPAGNNGTVKIETAGDTDGIPNNVPHVGCELQVEWYGFDQGDDIVSTVSFVPHAPTGGVTISGDEPSRVFVGGDPASGAGTDSGLDGVQVYRLSFTGEPHPQQGYHVTLTIHTPGSIGADTKRKVFWVEPCETTPPGEEQPPGEEPPPGGEEETPPGEEQPPAGEEETPPGEEETPPGDDTEVEGEQETDRGNDLEVLGEQATREQAATSTSGSGLVPTVVDAGLAAGKTLVASPLPLLGGLIGLLAAAAGYVVRRRRA